MELLDTISLWIGRGVLFSGGIAWAMWLIYIFFALTWKWMRYTKAGTELIMLGWEAKKKQIDEKKGYFPG